MGETNILELEQLLFQTYKYIKNQRIKQVKIKTVYNASTIVGWRRCSPPLETIGIYNYLIYLLHLLMRYLTVKLGVIHLISTLNEVLQQFLLDILTFIVTLY